VLSRRFGSVAIPTHTFGQWLQMKSSRGKPGLRPSGARRPFRTLEDGHLYVLLDGPQRTCEREQRISGISQKVLLEQLQALRKRDGHGTPSAST